MVQRGPDLVRVAFGEPDGREDGVEVGEVEAVRGAAEVEAAGGEVGVGGGVGGGGVWEVGGDGGLVGVVRWETEEG